MSSLFAGGGFLATVVILCGCGGASFSDATAANRDAAADSTSDAESSDAAADAQAVDGAGGGDTGVIGTEAGAADATPPACPDVGGTYALTFVDPRGCGDLNGSARECIRQTSCDIVFRSALQGSGAINGNASLAPDGSFGNASLKEGSIQRSGCTGTWDATTSTMTVDCGATGSSQSCVVALARTSSTCN